MFRGLGTFGDFSSPITSSTILQATDYAGDGLSLSEIEAMSVATVLLPETVCVELETHQKQVSNEGFEQKDIDCNSNHVNQESVCTYGQKVTVLGGEIDVCSVLEADSKESSRYSTAADDDTSSKVQVAVQNNSTPCSDTGRPLRSCRTKYNFWHKHRVGTEVGTTKSKFMKPHKEKPPSLSKYRRKTANTRERERMQEVNDAFDKLRHCIPNAKHIQKLTKITTLKLALTYIDNLQHLLGYDDEKYQMRLLSSDSGGSNSDGFASCSSDAGSLSPVHSPLLDSSLTYSQHLPPAYTPPNTVVEFSIPKWAGS